jgi:hypothetical protein
LSPMAKMNGGESEACSSPESAASAAGMADNSLAEGFVSSGAADRQTADWKESRIVSVGLPPFFETPGRR